jgi:hypothetical protein
MLLIRSVSRFVCFFAMHLLISAAEGADVYFYGLYNCIGKSLLTVACVTTDRA